MKDDIVREITSMGIADDVRQKQDKDGMLRRALERIIQLYTDKSHFVYELLQNAEDCGASKIKFCQFDDRLEVLHDGRPFSKNNLQGLCDIGKSDKINDLNQIGEFGVGFKSVFGICDIVKLYSHPAAKDYEKLKSLYAEKGLADISVEKEHPRFAVQISDFTHPEDIKDAEIEYGYTTKFIFPYRLGFKFSGFESKDKLNGVLSKRLQNLGITTLLFMKNLQSIDYAIMTKKVKASGSYVLSKGVINDHCSLVSALGQKSDKSKNNEESISYLVFSRPVKDIQEGRTIDIAFAVSVDDKGKYTFYPSKHPFISVYFPTETESKLNFIVQGPYRTTPNRSSVPAEDKDNEILAKQTIDLLCDSLIELRNGGYLDYSLLSILPLKQDSFFSSPLFAGMYDAVANLFDKEPLLLCKNGEYATKNHVKIARGDTLSEVLNDELLTELLNDGQEYHWLPTFLTESNKQMKEIYMYLTEDMKIGVIRPENLRNSFNENKAFLYKMDDKWLVKLYNLYASVGSAFNRGGSMRSAEIIKTSKGEFVAPFRKSDGSNSDSLLYRSYERGADIPNVFLPSKISEGIDSINFVDSNIYEKCKAFFTDILHLQKPDDYEFFIHNFKRRYEKNASFTDDQHISDVKKLLHYWNNTDYRNEVENLITNYLAVRCIKDGKKVYVNPNKETVYFPKTEDGMSIEMYFKNVLKCSLVDADFYDLEDITFEDLKKIGVKDDIAVDKDKTGGEYYTGNPGKQPTWTTYDEFRWKLNLPKLDDVLEYIEKHPKAADSMAKSSFIFRFLRKNEAKLSGTVYIGGSTPNINNAYSAILATIKKDKASYRSYGSLWSGKWLYTESMELVSHEEISKHDLNTSLYGAISYDSKLYEMLGFRKNEADILEDAAKDYDNLDDDTKDKFFEIELLRRYGISVKELEENYGGKAGSSKGLSIPMEPVFEFPSSNIKNWDALRKHAEEVLSFASPTVYAYKLRKIRVSKPVVEVQAYLKNMYKVNGAHKYACQMCHEPFDNVEMCQIANNPEVELDPMHLCLCPNCAAKYKKIRNDQDEVKYFLEAIENLTDAGIGSADPVELGISYKDIWFTQTHIAEIRELLALKKKADSCKDVVKVDQDDNKGKAKKDKEAVVMKSGVDVYKELIGKRVFHKSKNKYATVRTCDGTYLGLEFDNKPGKVEEFSLEMCMGKGFIEIV